MVRLVYALRVGLFPGFQPAQLPQPGADVTGPGSRVAAVAFP
jgi:hypothetical protein